VKPFEFLRLECWQKMLWKHILWKVTLDDSSCKMRFELQNVLKMSGDVRNVLTISATPQNPFYFCFKASKRRHLTLKLQKKDGTWTIFIEFSNKLCKMHKLAMPIWNAQAFGWNPAVTWPDLRVTPELLCCDRWNGPYCTHVCSFYFIIWKWCI